MNVFFRGVHTAHELSLANEICRAIFDFASLGAGQAQAECEARRLWLQGQIGAPWLASEIGSHTAVKTAQQAASEIALCFATFVLPEGVSVVIHPGSIPGAPGNCPAVCRGGLGMIEFAAGNMLVSTSTIGLSARQLTFHELIHYCGDVAGDNVPRMNWAGVGALMRATMQPAHPVAVVDSLSILG